MEDKYIELLLKKCARINHNKIFFIHYSFEIKDFIDKLIRKAKDLGIIEIYLDSYNIYEEHDFLANHTLVEIKNSNYFDKSIWDIYAKKQANFLFFVTEYPHVMDDINAEKIALAAKISRESRLVYRKMVEKCELSWCIAAYPGKVWAQSLFGDDEYAYDKLKQAIFRMCMLENNNPIEAWNFHLERQGRIRQFLNQLGIVQLHYTNSLGTDLRITLPEGYLFSSAFDKDIMVNMPSYEIFCSPYFLKTSGIVYSSKSLIYNGGLIDKFWLKFENGKVVDYDACVGRELLQSIIESDSNSCYLGECALVERNSPIARECINYGTTLIDENASCHLALGAGFAECIKDGLQYSDEELLGHGINISNNHVDFMIGTDDLKIEALLVDGSYKTIFLDGNFALDLVNSI